MPDSIPSNSDAILGGNYPAPLNALVLGEFPSIQKRLAISMKKVIVKEHGDF
jgi:hypothetical protein